MSADGKIADVGRSPARFSSPADQTHLENQVAQVNGILFGAGTLTACSINDPYLTLICYSNANNRKNHLNPCRLFAHNLQRLIPSYDFFVRKSLAGYSQQLQGLNVGMKTPSLSRF